MDCICIELQRSFLPCKKSTPPGFALQNIFSRLLQKRLPPPSFFPWFTDSGIVYFLLHRSSLFAENNKWHLLCAPPELPGFHFRRLLWSLFFRDLFCYKQGTPTGSHVLIYSRYLLAPKEHPVYSCYKQLTPYRVSSPNLQSFICLLRRSILFIENNESNLYWAP
jgi:hypothetical protein